MKEEALRNPFIVGLSLVFVWMHTMTGQLRDHAGLIWVAAFYACLSLFMVALVFLDKRDARARSMLSPTAVISGACLAGAPLMLFDLELPTLLPIPMHPLAVCVMGGYGIAHAYRSWSVPYSEMRPRQACGMVALALVIAAVIEFFMFVLGDAVACIMLAVVGVAIPTTLHFCYKCLAYEPSADESPARSFSENARAALPLWRIAVGISVYSFAMGVSWTLLLSNPEYTLSLTDVATTAIVILLVLAYWVCAKAMGRVSFRTTWRSIVLLMSAAILIAPQVEGTSYELVVSFVRAAQTVMASLWFLVLTDIARRMHIEASHVIGMGWVFYSLPVAAGVLFGIALAPIGPLDTVLPALTVLALVAIAFLADDRDLAQGEFFTDPAETPESLDVPAALPQTDAEAAPAQPEKPDDGMGSGRRDRLSVKCVAIARDYGLTNREFDVLVRLAHGRSGAYIAEELTLSENTVKGHTKRLYAKLGVHNRQELINLAEQYELKG